jgi:hypothetical protein
VDQGLVSTDGSGSLGGELRARTELVPVVHLEQLGTDRSADELGEPVVLDLEQRAHCDRDVPPPEPDDASTAPGEVTPLELGVTLVRGDGVPERTRPVGSQEERVTSCPECRPELAHSIGAVARLVGAPAADEPREVVGVIPVPLVEFVRGWTCYGVAEAHVLLDVTIACRVVDHGTQVGGERGHVDRVTSSHDVASRSKTAHVEGCHGAPNCSRALALLPVQDGIIDILA